MTIMSSSTRQVVRWLADYIRDNCLSEGDVLPSESEIGRLLEVGRSTVREALTVLKTIGLVRSKTKVGLVLVSDIKRLELLKMLKIDHVDQDAVKEIKQLRDYLELGSVDDLVENVTPEHLDELNRLILMVSLKEDSPITPADFETRFHYQLANITGNRFYMAISSLCSPQIAGAEVTSEKEVMSDEMIQNYLAIVNALEKKDLCLLNKALVSNINLSSVSSVSPVV